MNADQPDINGLEDLGRLWRNDSGPGKPELEPWVRRQAVRSRVVLLIETAVSAAGLAVGLWLVIESRRLLGISAIAFSTAAAAITWWARARAWQVETGSVGETVCTAIRHARSRVRAALGGLFISAGALLFLAVLLVSATSNSSATPEQISSTLSGTATALVLIAVALVALALSLVRAKSQLQRLCHLHAELIDE